MSEVPAYLTTAELARLWRKSPKTIRKWAAEGVISVRTYTDAGKPLFSLAQMAADERRLGELSAERRAS